jgi:uncharacterized membrane protein
MARRLAYVLLAAGVSLGVASLFFRLHPFVALVGVVLMLVPAFVLSRMEVEAGE